MTDPAGRPALTRYRALVFEGVNNTAHAGQSAREEWVYLAADVDAALVDQRCLGHGEGQEHALADVNAGLVDDLIQPRLAALGVIAAPQWQPIATAPKGRHDLLDLWCVGDREDIAFYCPDFCGVADQMLWQGRVTNIHWHDGAWRPLHGLRLHPLTVTPTHWMPLPPAPRQEPTS